MTVVLSETAGQSILERFKSTLEPFDREAPKPAKYRSRRCTVHTPSHQSLKECRRFIELDLMERAGEIGFLKQQVRLRCCGPECPEAKGHIVYVADFVYCNREGNTVVEDTTGIMLDTKRIKLHMLAARGIRVLIT